MCKIPKVLQDSLQYFDVTSLESDTSVFINLPTEILHYRVSVGSSIYYLYNTQGGNSKIFDILDIRNKYSFIHNIVGYDTTGGFPELKSEGDLLKVIIALDKECIKKFGDKCIQSFDFKEGVKVVVLPRIKKESLYSPYYVDAMTRYAGQIATITRAGSSSCTLDIDSGLYRWPKESLKLLKYVDEATPKPESKSESKSTSELNLFPTRKHYKLNFSY